MRPLLVVVRAVAIPVFLCSRVLGVGTALVALTRLAALGLPFSQPEGQQRSGDWTETASGQTRGEDASQGIEACAVQSMVLRYRLNTAAEVRRQGASSR